MLRELHIENFALLRRLDLSFGAGFNVLTGETGAGKSIIIDALGVLLGGRAGAELIRSGAENAVVEGVFAAARHSPASRALEEYGLTPADDESELILSREFSTAGRSRYRVNGRPVTREMVVEISEHLVDIYGQHEHQSLVKPAKQLSMLDAFGGDDLTRKRGEVQESYRRWRELSAELARLDLDEAMRAQRQDLLRFQVTEIEGTGLASGEDEALERERTILVNSEKLLGLIDRAYGALYAGSEGAAASDQVGAALVALDELRRIDGRFDGVAESVRVASFQLEEAAREIVRYRESVDLDPARLEYVEERLDAISRLKRKYAPTIEGILAHAATAASELATLETLDERRSELTTALQRLEAELSRGCESLSTLRGAAAERLSAETTRLLGELNMGKAKFAIALNRAPVADSDERGLQVGGHLVRVGPSGVDQCEFMLSANPGEELRPLARIASGGEMSRVMLALKALLSGADDIGTMIFDEIDAGISGRTGQVVAEHLARLGLVRQVVCVSHLPQIACMGETHLLVEKVTTEAATTVSVTGLDREGRAREIARLVGGVETTDITLRHAEEMLQFAERLRATWRHDASA